MSGRFEAARWDLFIQQGSTWARTLVFSEPIDFLQFRGQIRRFHEDPDVLVSFSFEIVDEKTVAVSLTAAQTAALPPYEFVYDMELFTEGDALVTRFVEGAVRVSPEVTRPAA